MKRMPNATYVDGFVFSVPKNSKAKYKKIAAEACTVWKKFGALDYKECVIDDAKPKFVTFDFATMTKAKADESVWFSFITFRSKAHRNEVNKKVMAYFAKKYGEKSMDMPFDMKRFAYAGFKVEVGM